MPSLDEIMKMAQGLQAEMEKAQKSLDAIEVEGAAGGGPGQGPRDGERSHDRARHRSLAAGAR